MGGPAQPATASSSVSAAAALRLALSDIKLAHSVFALPFAVLAAMLASPSVRGEAGWGKLLGQLGLVVLCMFLARTWAMLVNRIADWRIDARNPRTARRAVASGRLSEWAAIRVAGGFGAGFVCATAVFWIAYGNPWPLMLSVPVLGWIAFYSFTKRFTAFCHVFLGGALAASPVAAAVAVDPAYLATGPGKAIWFLAAMVVCWVAGFDVAYALQDMAFDRAEGLRSVPARWGVGGALWISRGLHVFAFAMLIMFSISDPRLGTPTRYALVAVGALLVIEHAVLARRGVAGLPLAFFTLNGLVSLTLAGAAGADVLLA